MRWESLMADHVEVGGTLPLFQDETVVRRFNTPEFKGITFYEVKAKSIINHVKGNRLGFNWTINPYRGCSHACAYCLDGETPILMADGRTKPLSQIVVGDEIYGTSRRGSYRRFVKTKVLAHWSTIKPAYRVTLADGTELIASGDHRFLTERGWKHVTGQQQGRDRRPHLTINNKLMGTGAFRSAPSGDADYRMGYLCGIIRGDRHLGSYHYSRAGRANGDVHRFRLALVDMEALARTRRYLINLQIFTKQFLFQKAAGARQEIYALRTSAFAAVSAIGQAVSWPSKPSTEWCKGFLAGIFDAEGSYSRGILRISNTDEQIIEWITGCLDHLGFTWTIDKRATPNSLKYVRVIGGLREALRFFHTTNPAITRKRSIEGQAIKSKASLDVVRIEKLGLELPLYDITTGTGDFVANGVISHNCFARPTHTYLDFNAGHDFESKIVVKINAVELLRRELQRPTWRGEHIAMGTNTDNYQRAEGRYRLMPGILAELNKAGNPYSILTKSTLIQRDIDLLAEGASISSVSACFSVGTVDEEVWKRTEPGTPHPLKRLEVVRKLNDSGVPCGVMVAPILPGISDSMEQMEATVRAAVEAGATNIVPIVLHLRPGVKEEFMGWLKESHPELVTTYEQMYRGAYAPKEVSEPITKAVRHLKKRHGAKEPSGPARPLARGGSGSRRKPKAEPSETESHEQMTLDLGKQSKRAPKWVKEKVTA
jgi:DNA repair photolyase